MDRRLLLMTLALASSGALAQTRTTELHTVGTPGPVDKATQTEDVRFRADYYQRMTVPVRVSGTGPYRFLVDTGADRTAISRELAERSASCAAMTRSFTALRAVDRPDRDGSKSSTHAQGSESDGRAAARERKYGRRRDPWRRFASLPADPVRFRRQDDVDRPVDGAGLSRKSPGPSSSRPIGATAASCDRSDREWPFAVVVIDTGSEVSIGNRALRRQLIGRTGSTGSEESDSIGYRRQDHGDYMYRSRARHRRSVGLKNLAIVFADAHIFKQLKLDRKPALLLGMNAIRAFKKVSIDFADQAFQGGPARRELPRRSNWPKCLGSASKGYNRHSTDTRTC